MTPWAPYADPAAVLELVGAGKWAWCSRSGIAAAEAAVRARLELADGEPATAERIRATGVDEWAGAVAGWRRNRNYYRRTLERIQRARR